MPARDHAVRCAGLSVRYRTAAGAAPALVDVDVDAPRHALTVVAGPSGSGKSSFLRVLAGLLRADAGTVLVDGTDLTQLSNRSLRRLRRQRMGLVLQRPADNLLEDLTALEQVQLAARLRGVDPAGAPDALAAVGLGDRGAAQVSELSGGEQQRVGFAAAAIGGPTLLLADEPTAQLDARAGAVLVETLRHLVEAGSTLVVASHDGVVIDAADHVVSLHDGTVVGP